MAKWVKYKDLIAAGAVLLLSTLVFVLSFHVKQNTISTIGPGFMPRFVAVLMAVFGLLNLKDACKKYKEKASQYEPADYAKKRSFGAVVKDNFDWVSAGLILVYVFSIGRLGFILSSCIYMFLQMLVLSQGTKRNWIVFVLLSVIVPTAVYFAFTKCFYLMLPAGLLG